MNNKPMKILIIEDDVEDCNNFIMCFKKRDDIELCAMTDSDIDALRLVKINKPDGIILDLELNNSSSGNIDSLEFLKELKNLRLNYQPIIIVTTHVNSKRTYEILHRNGVDLILYKDHPKYSSDHVLNSLMTLSISSSAYTSPIEEIRDNENKVSECINHELELIGISSKLKGRGYIHDAIVYLIENEDSDINVIQHLTKIYKKPSTTIINGIQNAIIHGWRVTPVEELLEYYTARINHQTGIPTPMELIYYYVDKVKKMI